MSPIQSIFWLITATFLPTALADLYMYPDASCDRAGYYEVFNVGTGFPSCVETTFEDSRFEEVSGGYRAWLQFDPLDDTCQGQIFQYNSDAPGQCASEIGRSRQGACVEFVVPNPLGTSFCCGSEDCGEVVPPASVLFAAVDERNSSSSSSSSSRHPRDFAPSRVMAPSTAVQKKRQDGCTWSGSPPYSSVAPQIDLTTSQSCSTPDGCTLSGSSQESFSSTNTFGIMAEGGVSFFTIVQASVSFSYEYSYSESESRTVTYTFTQAEGTTGHLAFVPALECTKGSFSGCNEIPNDQDGDACIPAQLENGDPDGMVIFVTDF